MTENGNNFRLKRLKLIMQLIISLSLITGGSCILALCDTRDNPELVAAASSMISITVGYWFR